MFLGLRLTDGISEQEFFQIFGESIDEIYGHHLDQLMGQGLLLREKGRIFLTDRGVDISNYVMAQFF